MAVVLGIDGGGTRTRASIVAGEQALAFAESGSIKRLRVGERVAEENLRALLAEVYKQAGVTGVSAASVGVASATKPGVTEWIMRVFTDFGVERSEVVGDEVIALDAAFKAVLEFCRSPAQVRIASVVLPMAAANARVGERATSVMASRTN
jgi:N-acetylglucosamine kinase-like BadF-type ATPase